VPGGVLAARRISFAPQAFCAVSSRCFFKVNRKSLYEEIFMNWDVELVSQVLNRRKIRATYGAVAAVVGCIPRNVMRGLPISQENSWVVCSKTGLPTGYGPQDLHPDLIRLPTIVRDPRRLSQILERELVAG